ncbi:hypothetical protein BHE74_00003850 [Ensete ventricosum]|nr:hypothetical protein BHE74_00003850 [Ensete ventricosum]
MKIIMKYKESGGFQLELHRSGQATYEYGYRMVLARFRAQYPDLEIEEDQFASLANDDNVDMLDEVSFDDNPNLLSA